MLSSIHEIVPIIDAYYYSVGKHELIADQPEMEGLAQLRTPTMKKESLCTLLMIQRVHLWLVRIYCWQVNLPKNAYRIDGVSGEMFA